MAETIDTDRALTRMLPVYEAVRYAMRVGCFHPVPEPGRDASATEWIRWGAMRNLHDAMEQAERWQL